MLFFACDESGTNLFPQYFQDRRLLRRNKLRLYTEVRSENAGTKDLHRPGGILYRSFGGSRLKARSQQIGNMENPLSGHPAYFHLVRSFKIGSNRADLGFRQVKSFHGFHQA
jgi:hypothetical protein